MIPCHHVSCLSKPYSFTIASDDASGSEHASSPEFEVKSVVAVKVKGKRGCGYLRQSRWKIVCSFPLGSGTEQPPLH